MKLSPEALALRPQGMGGAKRPVQWLSSRVGNGMFVDVGANVGTVCIPILLACPNATCTAFEPNPEAAEILCQLAERNGVELTIVQEAVSFAYGTAMLTIPTDRGKSGLATLGQPIRFNGGKAIEVVTTTLDDWWFESECPQVTAIKIDTEGAEVDVLLGARLLMETKPALVVEYDGRNLKQLGRAKKDLLDLLRHMGYRWERHGGNLYCE